MSVARFCPQCGTGLESRIEAGRLRPVCPNCGYIIYLNPTVAVGTLVEQDRRILLVRRAVEPRSGYWGLPAGYVEADETTEEAAVRETCEETGLQVQIENLLDVYSYGTHVENRGVLILYAAQVVGGQLQAGDDAVEAAWFDPQELPSDSQIAFSTHRWAIEDWRRINAIRYQEASRADVEATMRLARSLGEPLHDFTNDTETPNRTLITASDRSQVIGYAMLEMSMDRIAHLTHLIVSPEYRRWGIGTHLIEHVLAIARDRDARKVLAEVPATNPAVTLYVKVGFRVCGFRDSPNRNNDAMLFLIHDTTTQPTR